MRDHSEHIQVSREKALEIIIENCRFNLGFEEIPASLAEGRILAEDVFSMWDCPNTLSCRLDSVAVRWSDFENGMPDTSGWVRGRQWQFANTGVAMPEGFDTAIVIEHVILSENDTNIAFDALPSGKYAGTVPAGSRMKRGELLLKKGTMITPLLVSYIMSGNVTSVKVLKKPVVAFIPTGNELVSLTGEVPPGKNIESNSAVIAGKVRKWGGEPLIHEIVPDYRKAICDALLDMSDKADIIVLNAGSSKGSDDWGIEMLDEVGKVLYHQTNHGPGHHSSFGMIGNTPVVGISGPPGGAAFSADFYLYPAVAAYLGRNPYPVRLTVRLGEELQVFDKFKKSEKTKKAPAGEERPIETGEFYSVKQLKLRQADDGMIEAFPAGGINPTPVEAENADAYYLMPGWEGKMPPKIGDLIEVELRPDYKRG